MKSKTISLAVRTQKVASFVIQLKMLSMRTLLCQELRSNYRLNRSKIFHHLLLAQREAVFCLMLKSHRPLRSNQLQAQQKSILNWLKKWKIVWFQTYDSWIQIPATAAQYCGPKLVHRNFSDNCSTMFEIPSINKKIQSINEETFRSSREYFISNKLG